MLALSIPSLSRVRTLFASIATLVLVVQASAIAGIDRKEVVRRHNIVVREVDPEAALSVGNGDFAFTVDASGLQTFESLYYEEGIPLETMSTLPWAWHSFPNTEGLRLEDAMKAYDFHGRSVPYAALQQSRAGQYFRENPHPVALGQIGLLYRGEPVKPEALQDIDQTLDLWTGIVRTTYTINGQPVIVEVASHPTLSAVAVRVRSALVEEGHLRVRFRFPYSYDLTVRNKPPLDWTHPDKHQTRVSGKTRRSVTLERVIDDSRHRVAIAWQGTGVLEETGPHEFRMHSEGGDALTFTCVFAGPDERVEAPSFAALHEASARAWEEFWMRGGLIDLAGSTDPRARELERRIILSLYLTKVNYAGSFPPSETGLTHISWYGKHNSEMYFWHAAHFYQWGRTELLEKGLEWYRTILPKGKAEAASQGFDGVRWPKMAGIDGRSSPGTINPFIIWNQPNPIYLSELVYRARPSRETLEKYQDVVFESAKFLASFAHFDERRGQYVLGPPIRNVSESTKENNTQNPTFELAYWYYGLKVAQTWRERLGLAPEPKWQDILEKLAPLPVLDGLYLEIETVRDIYQYPEKLPTSMMMVLGFLPLTPKVDVETARRTFQQLNSRSKVGPRRWVSWSMGQGAMTAARLGDGKTAIDILTSDAPAARFMKSGHVRRPKEPNGCVTYLPVNSSFLCAVGLMAGGWDGAPQTNAPGFPQDGSWKVLVEGLNPMP
jgi:hypothetical protein